METLKISILIPTYEPNPVHLRTALDSVLAQTETRWSVFVHDDCSKTDVRAIVEPYLRDPRITFKRSSMRLGIGGNWNACLKHCLGQSSDSRLLHAPLPLGEGTGEGVALTGKDTDHRGSRNESPLPFDSLRSLRAGSIPPPPGEGTRGTPAFIQYLFQDDLLDTPYLERALKKFEMHPDAGFVALDHRYVIEGEIQTAPAYEAVRIARREIRGGLHDGREFLRTWIRKELHPNLIGEPSFVMLRRSLLERVGPFAEDMPQFLDVEYWVRCLLHASFVWVTEESGSFRVHPKAASARNEETGAGVMDRLRCFERLIAELPQSDLRQETIAARNRALTTMARKFLGRLRGGKSVAGAKGGALRAFAMRHPFLCIEALIRACKD